MIVIPVEISAFALSKSKEMPVHCFHILKQQTPGYTYLNKRQISLLSGYLSRGNRTVKRYLSYLENLGWIEPDGKVYVIKSWKRIFELMDFRYVIGVEANSLAIENPQAFYAGVVLGRLSNFGKYKREGTGKGKSTISRQCASTRPDLPQYFPIADRAIASILDISKTKANRLKKLAHKYGYVSLKYNYYPYQPEGYPVQIKRTDEAKFRKIFNDVGFKMRIDNSGNISVMDCDLIKPELRYKKCRNYL